jgi:Protein of unknown function (DUF1615)
MIQKQIAMLGWLYFCCQLAGPVWADDVSVAQAARLIQLSEKGVPDARGWAADLLDVLRVHRLERSRENACAAIAIIDQESSFRADPAVPGLGKLSETAVRAKLGKIPIAGLIALRMLENSPDPDDSYMSRIRNARTERDLDYAYRSFVDDASRRSNMSMLVNSGLLNRVIEGRNDINTAGSMQVSVAFAVDAAKRRRWLPMQLADVYAVRDELYTRRGGMYYGVLQLLGYDSGYSKKIFRFADYNAGRFASRNAAFQKIISELSGTDLALDGDLLLYSGGDVLQKVSATENALRNVAFRFKLDLDDKRIRTDLQEEKSAKFTENRTFTRVRDLYQRRTGGEPAFAIVPSIRLNSPKIKRTMTTGIFAESVNRKYQSCMGFKT